MPQDIKRAPQQQNKKQQILAAVEKLSNKDSGRSAILLQAFLLVQRESPDRKLFAKVGVSQRKAVQLVGECKLARKDLPDILNARQEIEGRINAETQEWFRKHPDAFAQNERLLDCLRTA